MHTKHPGKLTLALLTSLVLAAGCTSSDTVKSLDIPTSQEASANVAVSPNPCAGVAPATDVNPCAGAATETPTVETATEVAQTASQTVRYFTDGNGLAIRGTDPVAYFTQGGPVAGNAEYSYTWNNATWQFASAENRDLFAANPEQYAPQYGGFCAWAVSQGYTASIDPNAWRIVDGKLYLNYSRGVQRTWERDIPGNISKGDANWPGVLAGS